MRNRSLHYNEAVCMWGYEYKYSIKSEYTHYRTGKVTVIKLQSYWRLQPLIDCIYSFCSRRLLHHNNMLHNIVGIRHGCWFGTAPVCLTNCKVVHHHNMWLHDMHGNHHAVANWVHLLVPASWLLLHSSNCLHKIRWVPCGCMGTASGLAYNHKAHCQAAQ